MEGKGVLAPYQLVDELSAERSFHYVLLAR